jgi:dTMP kinase
VCILREPGSTHLSEAIRRVLLDVQQQIDPVAELMLFCAARRQLVQEAIRPALARGQIVICDRYADSTLAYQGYGRGLDLRMVEQVIAYAIEDVVPQVTFVLDVDVATALARRGQRSTDRMEGASRQFFERVRAGYHALAQQQPHRVHLLDATAPIEQLQEQIRAVVAQRIAQQVT